MLSKPCYQPAYTVGHRAFMKIITSIMIIKFMGLDEPISKISMVCANHPSDGLVVGLLPPL